MGSILDIIEAAYDLESTTDQWLTSAATKLAARYTGTTVPFAYLLQKTEHGVTFPAAYLSGIPEARALFEQVHAGIDLDVRDVFFPTGTSSTTMRARIAESPAIIRDDIPIGFVGQFGCDDSLGVTSMSPSGRGLLVGVMVNGLTFSASEHELLRRVAVHLGAGLRLRTRAHSTTFDDAEAVFETDGTMAHAQGEAASPEARQDLRDAITAIDRARAPSRRGEELAVTDVWQGLVEGRWSIVDRHDTDGRRYYTAIANPVEAVADRALTPIEAQVVAMAISGDSNKVIAYALGIAEWSVAKRLSRAMERLGVASRVELIALGLSLAGPPSEP